MSQKRSQARSHAVQAIYQWQMNEGNVTAIADQILADNPDSDLDAGYFRELLSGVTGNLSRLDAALGPHLDRAIASVDPVERAILRLATFELADRPEIPYKVVINEAVELAKVYGAEQGHKYVNGVLDKVALDLRAFEVQAAKGKR
jgi:N utilization substance protein B